MAASLRGLHPTVRQMADAALAWFEYYYGFRPTVTSGFRSLEHQQRLYDQWKAGQSPWPANPPGQSGHNYGLAFDSVVPDPYWPAWTALREWAGFRVPTNDRIHGEYPDWRRYV